MAAPTSATSGWLRTAPSSYAFLTGTIDGSKTLYAWAKDTTGNISLSRSKTIIIDITAPIVSTFTTPAFSDSHSISISALTIDDTTAKYLITESATPPTISATWASIPATPFVYEASSDGTKTLYAWAKDTAGNISTPFSQSITVDTIAPVVTFSFPSMSNTLSDIPMTLIGTDAVGVVGYLISDSATPPNAATVGWSTPAMTRNTMTFAANTLDGPQTLYAWAKDAAGHISASRSATVTIDRIAPTITAFCVPVASASRNVSITTFTASETLAGTRYLITESNTPPLVNAVGWSEILPTTYSASTDGSKTLYAWVKDAA